MSNMDISEMGKKICLNPNAALFTPPSIPSPPNTTENKKKYNMISLDFSKYFSYSIPKNFEMTNLISYQPVANENNCCYCLGELTIYDWAGKDENCKNKEWKFVCSSCVESIPELTSKYLIKLQTFLDSAKQQIFINIQNNISIDSSVKEHNRLFVEYTRILEISKQ